MKRIFLGVVLILLCLDFSLAATLKGSIYNSNLDLEKNVLVEVDTVPVQKFLAKEGTYTFNLPPGDYLLKAQTASFVSNDEIKIIAEGEYVRDIFLIPNLGDEELFDEETNLTVVDENMLEESTELYWIIIIVTLLVLLGIILIYFLFWKPKRQQPRSVSDHKQELAAEPGYLEETIEIIKKHGGRIYQTELRKEMMHLSESKISLILTELEHKGKIEKIKKGRGNAVILK
jgi:uncharacterized membrane protein